MPQVCCIEAAPIPQGLGGSCRRCGFPPHCNRAWFCLLYVITPVRPTTDEECGLQIKLGPLIGITDELIFATDDRT
jgi:hypothetical protein